VLSAGHPPGHLGRSQPARDAQRADARDRTGRLPSPTRCLTNRTGRLHRSTRCGI